MSSDALDGFYKDTLVEMHLLQLIYEFCIFSEGLSAYEESYGARAFSTS